MYTVHILFSMHKVISDIYNLFNLLLMIVFRATEGIVSRFCAKYGLTLLEYSHCANLSGEPLQGRICKNRIKESKIILRTRKSDLFPAINNFLSYK